MPVESHSANLPRLELLLSLFDRLSLSCCAQLATSEPSAADIASVSKAGFDLLHAFDETGPAAAILDDPDPDALSCAFALRALDRSLALIGVAQRAYRDATNEAGRLPYTGLLVDGAALLRRVSRGMNLPDFDLTEVPDPGWKLLLGATIADTIALIADLSDHVVAPGTLVNRAMARWEAAVPEHDGRLLETLVGGEILTAKQVADRLGLTEDEVVDRTESGELFTIPWWDRTPRYPEIQFLDAAEPSTGSADGSSLVPEYLPVLLSKVSAGISLWQLTIWLAHEIDGKRRVDFLDSDFGLRRLLSSLEELGYVAAEHMSGPTAPIEPPVAATRLAEELTRVASNGSSWRVADTGDSEDSCFYRINHRSNGPFWFACADRDSGNGGRFDLPDSGDDDCEGTCYLAETVAGAAAEVLQREPVLVLRSLLERTLWELEPLDSAPLVLDVTSDGTLERLNPRDLEVFITTERIRSQEFASLVRRAGFDAIRYRLRTAAWKAGIALFGPARRSAPEAGGHGSWLLARTPLVNSSDFWSWLEVELMDGFRVPAFLQLPDGIQRRPTPHHEGFHDRPARERDPAACSTSIVDVYSRRGTRRC